MPREYVLVPGRSVVKFGHPVILDQLQGESLLGVKGGEGQGLEGDAGDAVALLDGPQNRLGLPVDSRLVTAIDDPGPHFLGRGQFRGALDQPVLEHVFQPFRLGGGEEPEVLAVLNLLEQDRVHVPGDQAVGLVEVDDRASVGVDPVTDLPELVDQIRGRVDLRAVDDVEVDLGLALGSLDRLEGAVTTSLTVGPSPSSATAVGEAGRLTAGCGAAWATAAAGASGGIGSGGSCRPLASQRAMSWS